MLKDVQIKKQFISLEEKLFNPLIRKSAEEVSHLLSDDYLEFSSSEKIYYKKDALQALQEEHTQQISAYDFNVNLLTPEIALVTYTAVKNDKTNINATSLRSSLWKKTEENWQIVFHQASKIQK